MKTILVATDFSLAASNATSYATQLALAIGADILLFHVYEIPLSFGELPITMTPENIHEHAEREINLLRDQLNKSASGKIKVAVELRSGRFYSELEKVCDKINPYVVVIGSQGTTSAERILFGAHSLYAMKHLEWPLLSVPAQAQPTTVKKIAFACDMAKPVESSKLQAIVELTRLLCADLHIINIGPEEKFNPDLVFQAGKLEELLSGLKPRIHFITNENIDEGILDFVEQNKVDLLILLPKRHGILDRIFHKSHSQRLVLQSHVPILAFH